MAGHIWADRAGIVFTGNLSISEEEELDTLVFQKNCDYPYSQERIDELVAKNAGS